MDRRGLIERVMDGPLRGVLAAVAGLVFVVVFVAVFVWLGRFIEGGV